MTNSTSNDIRAAFTGFFARNGHAERWEDQPVGTPEDVLERVQAHVDIGYRHLIFGFPPPYDEESMTRLVQEVRPKVG